MGSFNYIISGNKDSCHQFFEALPHCYSKDIMDEYEYDDECDLWISGECKYLPDIWWLKDQSKELQLELKGSYENEDREPDEEPGTYIHLVNGKYKSERFAGNEKMFLNINQYDYE